MSNQVKFYSTTEFASTQNNGGIYFVGSEAGKAGEIYKGTQRFGAARVTTVETEPTDAIRGDINIFGGNTKVFNGTSWVTINDSSLLSAALVGSSSGLTSIITGISESNGVITAYAQAFPSLATGDAAGEVKFNGVSAKVSGWDSLTSRVSTTESKISAIETWKSSVTGDTIVAGTKLIAETGTFKNLDVSDTATFSATTVTATSLTIDTEANAKFGGSTIAQIADRQIAAISSVTQSGTNNGVTVSVTTSAGSVTGVSVSADVTSTVSDTSSTKLTTEGAVKNYVDGKFTNITNVMDFVGVVTELPTTAQKGDVVAIGENPTGDNLVHGQEYIYDGEKWELIGDQKTWAANAYTPNEGAVVDADTHTLPSAIKAVAAGVDKLNGADTVDGSVAKSIKTAVEALGATVTTVKDDNTTTGVHVSITETDGKLTSVTAELVWLGADGTALT